MKYEDAYRYGCEKLINNSISDARFDAAYLLEMVCNTDRNDLYSHPDRELTDSEWSEYQTSIQKRSTHIPLQHITGMQEFMGLNFTVSPSVLIPRQDTETLVEEVLRYLQDGMEILDMCTGSGCILLSLLHYSNHCIGTGADISADALSVAKKNAETLGIPAEFIQSDLFLEIQGRFDIIVSNPPYIKSDIIDSLEPEVRDHEPLLALDGDKDGVRFYRLISSSAKKHLNRGGMLFFEIGYDEKDEVEEILRQEGYLDVTCVKDLSGNDRVIIGTYRE